MQSHKCKKCGLVNVATASNCKKCGSLLTEPIQERKSEGKSIIYNGGVSDGVNLAIILITACVVCSLTIYWAKQYIPEGTYLVGCFIPFAFLGLIAGVILANIANLIYKQISSAK